MNELLNLPMAMDERSAAMLAEYGCRPHPFQRDEFQLLLDNGFFIDIDNRVELVDGEIVEKDSGQPVLFSGDEVYRMTDLHLFEEIRFELIEGEIIEMPGQKNVHAAGIMKTFRALDPIFISSQFWVRIQMTLDLRPLSSLDPDIAVVKGDPNHPTLNNPTTALLIVEVSNTSLRFDRRIKGPIYAAAGIEEYWILNLNDRQLEVYRRPQADPTAGSGMSYAESTVFHPGDFVAPLAAGNVEIAVADLLP